MIDDPIRDQIIAGMTDEAREIFFRIEKAVRTGEEMCLSAEEADCLKRLFLHVMSMNIRIEEWIAASD